MKYYYVKALEKILTMSGCRKLVLYKMDILSEIIYQNLLYMGKDVEYFISDDLSGEIIDGKEVRNVYDLLYEDIENVFVLVFALSGHASAYEKLIGLGYEFEKDFCICGMAGYSGKFDAIDSLLGFNRRYDDVWGFKVYGDSDTADIRIMTLGGSTSDPTLGNYHSWPEQLYENISKKYNVVLYSGGLTGYSVNQEFMKFVRDGLTLKPDILITFDGYNDAGFNVVVPEHPLLHRYQSKFYNFISEKKPMAPDTLDMRNPDLIVHGLDYSLTDSENWITAIRKIHAVAVEFNIHYYSFFQPMILSGQAIVDDSITLLREEIFRHDKHYQESYNEIIEYAVRCQEAIKEYPFITDLSSIFDGEEDVYYDICHSTDKGNYIIMNHIYDVIEKSLEELAK